ncbi:MAG: hypothetical protein ACKVID_03540, partial [Gammaproteobacteria bacterium]
MQYKIILALLLMGVMTSCSSLNFWSNESDEDFTTPAKLLPFTSDYLIDIAWKKSFKGSNNLGAFKPAFYSGQMIVADSSGNI